MNEFFFKETVRTVDDIKKNKKNNLTFVLLSDTKLCDTVDDTIENIKTIDNNVHYDCIVHMGNVINGNNPRDISMKLLNKEFDKFIGAVGSKRFFPVQGRTDGYRDERFYGQLAINIMTDELWDQQIAFVDKYDNVKRNNKPYYYVDYPENKVRFIMLSAYAYQINDEIGYFTKKCQINAEQAGWLSRDALNVENDWTVMIFSGGIPESRFENGKDPFIYNGYSTEPLLAIVQQAHDNGVNIACWFSGGYGYDAVENIAGINFVLIEDQLPDIKKTPDRLLETRKQDCWDTVILNTEDREIKLIRFGYGEDRVITY